MQARYIKEKYRAIQLLDMEFVSKKGYKRNSVIQKITRPYLNTSHGLYYKIISIQIRNANDKIVQAYLSTATELAIKFLKPHDLK